MLFIITKYLIALTIITILSVAETNAQLLNLNILSFNNNRAGNNSLNGNANAGAGFSVGQGPRPQSQPFGSWYSVLNTSLNLFSSFANEFGYPYSFGNYPYYFLNNRVSNWYGGISPYRGFIPYYNPYYYYYYRG
ncbi:hypothetical protein ACH3XW_11795 [Acanthocheilonema viteae]